MYDKPTLPESKMFYNADGLEVHTNMRWCTMCGSPSDLVDKAYLQCQANSTHIAHTDVNFINLPEEKAEKIEVALDDCKCRGDTDSALIALLELLEP